MLNKILGTTGTRLLNAGLTFLILWITTNYLGKEGVGTISLIILDITIILLINDFIGGSALVYFTSRIKITALLIISYLWTLIVICIFYLIFLFLSLFPNLYNDLIATGYEQHILILSILYAYTLANYNILLGLEKIKRYNLIFSLQIIVLTAVLSVNIFIFDKHEVISYVIAMYFSLGLSWLTGLLAIFRNINFREITNVWKSIKQIYSYGSMTQLANIIHLTNKRLSYFVIKSFIGLGSLGVYSASVQLTEGLRILGQSISLVQFSRISNCKDMEYAKVLTIRLLKFTLFITFMALLIILILPTDFFVYVFSEDFRNIRPVILSLSIGVLSISASMIFAHYFSGIGKPKYNMISSACGLVTTVLTAFILIPRFGIIGAGLSVTIAYFTSTVYHFIMFVIISKARIKEFIPSVNDFCFFYYQLKKYHFDK